MPNTPNCGYNHRKECHAENNTLDGLSLSPCKYNSDATTDDCAETNKTDMPEHLAHASEKAQTNAANQRSDNCSTKGVLETRFERQLSRFLKSPPKKYYR